MSQNAKPIILWDNLLAGDGVELSATSEAIDHPIENIADWREYLTWLAGNASSQDLKADLQQSMSASFVCAYNHDLCSCDYTDWELFGSDNGSDWTSVTGGTVTNDNPILKYFNATSYRYWKLSLTAGEFASAPELGFWFLGSALVFPAWNLQKFDPSNLEVVLEKNESEKGYLLGSTIKYQRRRLSLSFRNITDSWIRNTFQVFWDAHVPLPFLFAWDYLNHPEDVSLLEVAGNPKREALYDRELRSLKIEMEGRVA